MNIKDYAKDVGLSVAEVLKQCEQVGIKADNNTELTDDDIINFYNQGVKWWEQHTGATVYSK